MAQPHRRGAIRRWPGAWRGGAPRPAISLTTADGIVVRFDEEAGELVGFTILNWDQVWAARGETFEVEVVLPDLEAPDGAVASERHELEAVLV
jgi:hypothetical protein